MAMEYISIVCKPSSVNRGRDQRWSKYTPITCGPDFLYMVHWPASKNNSVCYRLEPNGYKTTQECVQPFLCEQWAKSKMKQRQPKNMWVRFLVHGTHDTHMCTHTRAWTCAHAYRHTQSSSSNSNSSDSNSYNNNHGTPGAWSAWEPRVTPGSRRCRSYPYNACNQMATDATTMSCTEPEVRGSQEFSLAPDDVGVTPTTPAIKWLRIRIHICIHIGLAKA
jgi:hypothetical protein